MDRNRRDTLLGIVFFGTLGFLLWATVNLTNVSLGDGQEFIVRFADGGGAQVGTNVLVLGKKLGKVVDIDVDYSAADTPVTMAIQLEEKVPLTDRAVIEVRADGVLGGKLVYIDPGRGTPVAEGTELLGKTQQDLFTRLGDIAEGKGILGTNINDMVSAIRIAFESLQDDRNTLGRLLTRSDLYDEVMQTAVRINSILEAIQGGQSTLGRLAVDTAMGERVQAIIDNLATASAALTTSDGTVGLLLNDPTTAANVHDIIADFATLTADAKAGKGIVGGLLQDKEWAVRFDNALANLDAALQKINDPNAGLIGAAFSDPTSAEDFKIAVANLRDVTDSLTQEEGALGILINDKDVGIRLRRIFTQVSRSLEDAREAAPISSFVQVLLGVF